MALDVEVPQGRSPRFPRYSLPATIGYARRLYDGAHRSLLETETAFKVMGFTGKSGASSSALGALRQYGLVEAPKGGVRISQIGLQILEPSNQAELAEALVVAAGQPTVFSQIQAHFNNALPRSDEAIRAFLIRQLDFSKKGADECISSLRETLDFVSHNLGSTPTPALEDHTETKDNQVDVNAEARLPLNSSVEATSRSGESMRIPLTRTCSADLALMGDVTSQAIERLIQHIELMKDVWSEE